MLAVTLASLLPGTGQAADALHVAFINPGHPASFWGHVEEVMRDAAADLEIRLTVFNAQGDRATVLDSARRAVLLADKPDALVVVNEWRTGGELIEIAEEADVPVFMILTLFTGREAAFYGTPRRSFAGWIGSLRPDHEKAGYAIARALIAQGRAAFGNELRIMGLGGNITSQATLEREAGLKRAVAESNGVTLSALVNADWRRDFARSYVQRQLRADPDVKLIWAANDDMALGALDAVENAGLRAGKDVLIGGLNWSSAALDLVREGRMAVDVGGHFLGGGLALVLIHDYLNGRDFADEGTALVFDMGTFDGTTVPEPGALDFEKIDFRSLSRLLNRGLATHALDIDRILGEIGE